jgi:hypothetical protein
MPHATADDAVELYYAEAGEGTDTIFVDECAGVDTATEAVASDLADCSGLVMSVPGRLLALCGAESPTKGRRGSPLIAIQSRAGPSGGRVSFGPSAEME